MKRNIVLTGILAVELVFIIVVSGCLTTPATTTTPKEPSPEERFIEAAQQNEAEKMEEAFTEGSDPQEFLYAILTSSKDKSPWNETSIVSAIEFLIQKGADVNKQKKFETTGTWHDYDTATPLTAPLMYNAGRLYWKQENNPNLWSEPVLLGIVKCLLSHGADTNARFSRSRFEATKVTFSWLTPMYFAKNLKNTDIKDEMIALLIEHGAVDGGVGVTFDTKTEPWSGSSTSDSPSASSGSSPSSTPAFNAPLQAGTYKKLNDSASITFTTIEPSGTATFSDPKIRTQRNVAIPYTIQGNFIILTDTDGAQERFQIFSPTQFGPYMHAGY